MLALISGDTIATLDEMIEAVSHWLQRLVDLALNRSATGSDRERRSRSIVRGTAAALVARGIGSLTGIITVPLTVRYLGAERYGAWMTISSVLVFLGFSDFGLASSLTNALGKAFGEGDRESARRHVTTTLVALSLVAVLLVVAGISFAASLARVMFPNVDDTLLRGEIVPALIVALSIFALNFPLLITNRVLAAYQENATANIWIVGSSVANLIGILIVILFRGGLPALLLGSAGSGLLVNTISSIWLYGWHKPWLAPTRSAADLQFARELFSTSWKFFIANVAWIVNSQIDNLIIAHYLGPKQVTPYSVTFRLFAYATLIQGLAVQSIWPAFTEALARKDFDWIKGIYRKNLKISLLIAICALTVLTAFGESIIRVWAGPAAVPPFATIVWMAVWNLILGYLLVPSALLQATNRVTGLTVYGSITAVLNLTLSILFVQAYGISGVIAATVIAYAVSSLIPVIIESSAVLRNLHSVV
jgi:O-antigen/teichoic acid export membrane protein